MTTRAMAKANKLSLLHATPSALPSVLPSSVFHTAKSAKPIEMRIKEVPTEVPNAEKVLRLYKECRQNLHKHKKPTTPKKILHPTNA